jgi:arginyl-tRNA synthetase
MINAIEELQTYFRQALSEAFVDLLQSATDLSEILVVTPSTHEQFGHYQFNGAMRLAKQLRRSPIEIAKEIQAAFLRINAVQSRYEKIEIAGAGFINITLSPAYLSQIVKSIYLSDRCGVTLPQRVQRIIVEFSSPNTAKELHVGHLRSTIIGDSLARLFEFLGHNVLRLNHIGDWGTPFGMLITYLRHHQKEVIEGDAIAPLEELVVWYRSAKALFEEDENFKEESYKTLVALQQGDADTLRVWNRICEISRRCYETIYEILDVQLLERGESFYNPMIPGMLEDLEARGYLEVSDGAKCVFCPGFTNREGERLPFIIQKSDGGYNYNTTDLAAMKHRAETERAERIIVVTDAGQALHFEMLEAAARKVGYLSQEVRFDHVPFGLVLRPDGKKFQTRSGDTEKLTDLLYTAINEAEALLNARETTLTRHEIKEIANAIGISAVKYADLSSNRIHDYVFSYDRMLRFDGNTAAFLMYSYVRIAGIKRKVQRDSDSIQVEALKLEHESEIALGVHIQRFGEIIHAVADDLLPHRIAEYLYALAEKFNAFFRDCRVEGSAEMESRLVLCEVAAKILKTGFHLLGIKPVERM